MNVSKAGGVAVAARSATPPRAAEPRDEAPFAVPEEDAPRDDEAPEAPDEDEAPLARALDLSAWMLPPPPIVAALAAKVDLADPAAQRCAPKQCEPPADPRGASPAAPPVAPSPVAPSPELPRAPSRDAAAAASPEQQLPAAVDGALSSAGRPRAPSPKPAASAAEPAAKRTEAPRAPDAPAPGGAAPDVAAAPVTGPSVSWATPPGEGPRADGALTAVNDLTPSGPREAAAAARERLHDAATSSAHQRALRDVAQGELTLPELGRVAVRAHAARDAVDVEIRAAQPATAHALLAQAESLAADIRAADISVTRLSFQGAGAWIPSQDATPRGRDEAPERHPREEVAARGAAPAPGPRARVRIVL